MSKFKDMTDDYLRRNYVPAVYQPSIYAIDYQKLKDAGVKLISYDIDDTIADLLVHDPPKEAVTLFENLKNMGFKLMLLSNAKKERVKNYADKLGISGCYISRAEKPLTTHFQTMQELCGVEKSQMAHVGNAIRDDVAGGNAFGIITCLVRRAGVTSVIPNRIPGHKSESQKLRDELKKRGIWRKHHMFVPNDQYYQLGEQPPYIQSQGISQTQDIAEEIAADLIGKIEADKDKTFTLSELRQNYYQNNEDEGIETLHNHLGDDIVFTGTWTDAKTMRELEKSELSDGEMSGLIFTIGCYTIRSTLCLYRDDSCRDNREFRYEQKVPAKPDEIAKYRENRPDPWSNDGKSGFREVQVMSAKHKDSSDWHEMCMATNAFNMHWTEEIISVCTLKYDDSAPDEEEMLFVQKKYIGDSFSVIYCSKLSPDGTVTEYDEHPYNPESFKKSWR